MNHRLISLWNVGIRLVVLGVAILASPLSVGAQSNRDLFQNGNQAYQQGRYDEAITAYQAIIDRQVRNADVFYNLGNAWFKKGEVARAILSYERAVKLRPRDRDLRQNLQFARNQIIDKIDNPNPSILFSLLGRIHGYLTVNEWTLGASLFATLLCLLIVIRMFLISPLARDVNLYALVVVSAIVVVTLAFLGFKVAETFYSEDAIIMAAKVEIRSGPAQTYTMLMQVHAGLKVDVVQKLEGWTQVRLVNGYEGWVPAEAIAII